MGKTNRSFVNMISGGAGYIAPMLVNLVSTPMLVRILGEASFGIQSLFNVIIGYLMVADMGMDIPITKFVAENNINNKQNENSKLLSSTLQIYFTIGCLGALLLYGLAAFFSNKLFTIPDHLIDDAVLVFKFAGLGFFANTINMWGRATLNGYHRYDLSNGVNSFCSVMGTLTGLVGVYYGYGVVGFVFFKVLFSFISLTLFIILIKNKTSEFVFELGIHKETWIKIKNYLGYGVVMRISGMILGKMDQTLIGIWLGVAMAGIYSIPFLIPTTINYFISSIFTFVFPIICEHHASNKKNELRVLFINYTRLLAIISTFIFFPLFLFGDKFLNLWVGELIADKTKMLFLILSLSFFITVLSMVLSNLFMIGIGHMKYFTQFAIIKGVVTLIGLLILIKPFGINGAGMAILISSLCDFGFFIVTVKSFLLIRLSTIAKVYFKPLLVGTILSFFFYFLRPFVYNWIYFTLFVGSFVIIYLVIIYHLKLLSEKERAFIIAYYDKLKINKNNWK